MNTKRRDQSADERKARKTASAYLHAARNAACPDDALEAASWAQCLAPGGVPALRLAIRLLIQLDMTDEADALIARGLLLRPQDPPLLEMQANSFLQHDRLQLAESTIARVITLRPRRRSARHVAAHVALRCKQPTKAIDHLEQTLANVPEDDLTRRWLIEIHLENGHVQPARDQLNKMRAFDPLMRARIMRRLGRDRDAQDLLEAAISIPDEAERCALELIDLIQTSGDQHTFTRLYTELVSISATVRRRIMEARLRFGHLHAIMNDLGSADTPGDALIALIAGADTCAFDVARDLLDRVRSTRTINDEHVARLWHLKMIAEHAGLTKPLLHDHTCQCDHSPLIMLLQSAMASLQMEAASDPAAARHLAEVCIALGKRIEFVPQHSSAEESREQTSPSPAHPPHSEPETPPLRRAA